MRAGAQGQRVRHRATSRRARCSQLPTRRPRSTSGLGMPLDPARAAREPRRDRGRPGGHACLTWSTLDQIRGDLHTHTDWSDGKATLEQMVDGRAGARLRVPERHRPLARGRVRHGPGRRPAARADRARARAGGDARRRVHAARRAPRWTSSRTARSTTPTSCWPSWTWSSRACTRRTGCRPAGPDEAGVRGDGEPARRHHRPPDRRGMIGRARGRIPWTSRR